MISATIGVYDGIHRGHLEILKKLKAKKGRKIVFVFHQKTQKNLLTDIAERKEILKSLGFKVVVLEAEKIWKLSAYNFFHKFLLRKFKINRLVIGEDFVFGHKRQGTPTLLKKWCRENKIQIEIVKLKKVKGEKISSSCIKKLLLASRICKANAFLGRPYSIKGTKIKGAGISQKLGFPTVNLKIPENRLKPLGVFFGFTKVKGRNFYCLINSGPAPVFRIKDVFEFHILKRNVNVEKQKLFEVFFLKFLRPIRKFKNRAQLVKAVCRDIEKGSKLAQKKWIC